MTVYLICFRTPDGDKGMYKHAGHYLGFTDRESADCPEESVKMRLREHRGGYGAALTSAAASAGLELEVARIWPDGTKNDEWRLRCRHENARLCPFCNPEAHRLATEV